MQLLCFFGINVVAVNNNDILINIKINRIMTQKLLIDNTKRAAYLIIAGSIFFSVSILICHGTFTLEEN
jgi:hypothetical protein